ncbi:MAG TPA: SAM-dependent methyltransferase, partial [Methylomirabilota bacterium]|nr:SAM-dependent methyltransferase [Methylomirabilota bacterium]
MSSGRVVLVGAGPGDPELITLRGLRWLRRADVVVYDQLTASELLDEAPEGALRIFAGKSAGRHCLEQSAINAIL